jgi:hypothetical protein
MVPFIYVVACYPAHEDRFFYALVYVTGVEL